MTHALPHAVPHALPPSSGRRRRLVVGLLVCVLAACGLVAASPAQAAPTLRPVVFVHGFMGSGTQFETQAQRFASNGYPAAWLEAQEYDTISVDQPALFAALDARIARLKATSGASQVELMGHSLGTVMSQQYLTSSPARAANVAHYVNVDGAGAGALPGGVPTLNIRGQGNEALVTGAADLALSSQSHVQTATSAEAFAAMYRFFTGEAPATTGVAPEATIRLAGRAITFPANEGVPAGTTLTVHQVDPQTGRRIGAPVATPALAADGSWGPITASGTASYEFAVTQGGSTHHYYQAPYQRSDLLVRLLTSTPGTGIDLLLERNARHVTLLGYRDKEFWGDGAGADRDSLTANGTEVLNDRTAPASRRTIGLFAYDALQDRSSAVRNVPGLLGVLPFVSGTDLYLPASPDAAGTVTLRATQRGNRAVQTLAVPNWPSDRNVVTARFRDR